MNIEMTEYNFAIIENAVVQKQAHSILQKKIITKS